MANLTEEQQEDLSKFTLLRETIKLKLSRFEEFLNNLDIEPKKISQLQPRLDAIYGVYAEFNDVQYQIDILQQNVSSNDRQAIEDTYFDVIARANDALAKNQQQSSTSVTTHGSGGGVVSQNVLPGSTQVNVKLPLLTLKPFYGEASKWTEFYANFDSLIGSSVHLDKVQKFQYLHSALKGSAAQIIDSLAISAENYNTALELLKTRYENKKVLIHAHVKGIFDLPVLNKESHENLRNLTDTFTKHFRALQNLNEKPEDWSTILIHLILTRLDSTTKREWEEHSVQQKEVKINELIEFINNRCQLLEVLDTKNSTMKSSLALNKKYNEVKLTTNLTYDNYNYSCKKNHGIYHCADFKSLSVDQRLTEAKRLQLCTNCLRPTHKTAECTSSGCRICNQRHNSVLHRFNENSRYKPPINTMPRELDNQPKNQTQNSNYQHSNNQPRNDNSRFNNSSQFEYNRNSYNQNARNKTFKSNDRNEQSENSTRETQNNVAQTQELTSQQTNSKYIPENAISSHSYCNHNSSNSFVILSTARVLVSDGNSEPIFARVLLDSGSQSNFVTDEFVKKLQVTPSKINMPIHGINSIIANITSRVNLHIASQNSNYEVTLPFLVIENITGITPQVKLRQNELKIPSNIKLADENFGRPSNIDMLLGNSVFFDLLKMNQIRLGEGLPILNETKLGWIVSGEILCSNIAQIQSCNLTTIDLHNKIERFWQVENNFINQEYTKEEIESENHFAETFSREKSGRFIVKLPVRDNITQLGDSLNTAERCFLSLERKLNKNPELKQQYVQFLNEYQSLGHMTKITPSNSQSNVTFYLPHHAVEKPDHSTTKVRVVFNASAKTSTGLSLNDALKCGPSIQPELFSIILRFRKHAYVLIGDICKMYRQINVSESDRDLQRILWRANSSAPLMHYRLNTVTYGTSSASFLATRCLKQLSLENRDIYPIESQIISDSFYMDDLLTGNDDINKLVQIRDNINLILKSACLELRKFASNNNEVLRLLSEENTCQETAHLINDTTSNKTLGILWNPKTDSFIYDLSEFKFENKSTKRIILSNISQIFNPLGILGPIIIKAKLIVQKLWQLKIDWDETVPENIHNIWREFSSQLSTCEKIYLPRHCLLPNAIKVEIHTFSDASVNAYGAVVYARSQDQLGNIKCSLLCAKSRVAPLKAISLPRLELCGAVLAATLADKVIKSLNIEINKLYYWTDSTIVLSWLALEPRNLKVFVCNRVAEIQRLTDTANWYHVESDQNSADLISRGLNPNELVKSRLWFNGPDFLSKDNHEWPEINHISKYASKTSNIPDLNAKDLILICTEKEKFDIFDRFSKLQTLVRVSAYCFRFVQNCLAKKRGNSRNISNLTVDELTSSKLALVRSVQKDSFYPEINALKRKGNLARSSKILNLDPFLENDGILRVGGRLKNSNLTFQTKHPILLPKAHSFTRLVIIYEHERHLHSGNKATLSHVRQTFWPISGGEAVKAILRKCVVCFKAKPIIFNPLMGQLPGNRVKPSRTFSTVGVDYCGHFYIKDGKLRNRKLIKSYVCVFVCLASKAVHLELVTELSTDAFISALSRFASRRGCCTDIYSDNGKNFVGAEAEFQKIFSDPKLTRYATNNNFKWHFIPPRSPNFGGLWEAAVKSVKHHLHRVTANLSFTYEEFNTLIVQIEAILNSRPIIPLSCDANDYEALTPGHFIIGEAMTALPQTPIVEPPKCYVSRFRHIQVLIQQFWKHWQRDYLHHLQQRSKWRFQRQPAELLGALVIIQEENLPPQQWRLARIVNIHPGKDGIVRVLSLKTSSGILKRAMNRVCILPIEIDNNVPNSKDLP